MRANRAVEEAGSAAEAVDDGIGVIVIAVSIAAGMVALAALVYVVLIVAQRGSHKSINHW